mgnify:CR=1 FL=1
MGKGYCLPGCFAVEQSLNSSRHRYREFDIRAWWNKWAKWDIVAWWGGKVIPLFSIIPVYIIYYYSFSWLEVSIINNGNGEVLRGFDITTKVGNYYIANNYEITSNLQTQHIWNVEVILVNLDSDQNANAGKVVDAYLEVSKGE